MSKIQCGLLCAVPTLHRYEGLVAFFDSVEAGSVRPETYLAVDNGGTLEAFFRAQGHEAPWASRLKLKTPSSNVGVAAAWNLALEENYAWTLIAGDDCLVRPNTVESLMDAAKVRPEFGFYSPVVEPSNGRHHSEWACFLQAKTLTDRIGRYDEVFFPGWFEDDDYRRRMALSGIRPAKVIEAKVSHLGGATSEAATLADEQGRQQGWNERWVLNQGRYAEKWGGPPGQETVTSPRPPVRRNIDVTLSV